MQVTVSLDALGRWRWQMQSAHGQSLAESCGSFPTYSLAVLNANAVCQCIPDAPVEIELPSVPAPLAASARLRTAFDAMCLALHTQGLPAALAVLNGPVPHRYTAVYWMPDAQQLVNVAAFDKLGEVFPPGLRSVAYNQSFCQYAIREGQFRTANSALDHRLDGNVYQGVLNSYHAVPLVSANGQVVGTLCHFDTAALVLEEDDFELLRLAAPVLVHALPRSTATLAPTGSANG